MSPTKRLYASAHWANQDQPSEVVDSLERPHRRRRTPLARGAPRKSPPTHSPGGFTTGNAQLMPHEVASPIDQNAERDNFGPRASGADDTGRFGFAQHPVGGRVAPARVAISSWVSERPGRAPPSVYSCARSARQRRTGSRYRRITPPTALGQAFDLLGEDGDEEPGQSWGGRGEACRTAAGTRSGARSAPER